MKPHILRKSNGRCWAVRHEDRRKPFHQILRWFGVGQFAELAEEWAEITQSLAQPKAPSHDR